MWAKLAVSAVAIARVVSSQNASSSRPIPVTGAQTGIDWSTGARPTRLNINDLYSRGGPQWDLYVQALAEFQATNESDELSYFQISGIHGLPFLPWNGAEQVPDGPSQGYCPHGEVIFPTWHRPFVALFEQVLVSHALRISKKYPAKMQPVYEAAALSLRQPYWDWATDHNLPLAATSPNFTVNTPDGPNTVVNPLSRYWFNNTPSGAGFGGALQAYHQTVRCPVDGGTSDSDMSDAELGLPYLSLTSQTYAVFTQSSRYELMASMSSPGPSFEAPHNNIHNYAGCPNGTLAAIGWSAFDPLFMLHHANVDRLIAMWQAIHYNASTMNTTSVSHGTFGTAEGSIIDVNSPLKPFFNQQLEYYNSNTASRIKDFGYTYPEITDWQMAPDELARYVTSRVNDLYGQRVEFGVRFGPRRRAAKASTMLAYSAEIQVDRSEVTLPCVIDLTLGGHVLGRMSLLAMPTRGISYTTIPLGDALQKLSLKDMPENTLVPYLQQNLEVEVRQNEGMGSSRRLDHTIPSLAVELQGQEVAPGRSASELPRYGVARRWPVRKHR